MWVTQVETEHFSWIAAGKTAEESRQAWRDGFRKHIEQSYGDDAVDDWIAISFDGEDPLEYYGDRTVKIKPGQCLRDLEPIE